MASFNEILDGGNGGGHFRAASAPIIQAATKEQADEQYLKAQEALKQQQAFLAAVQAQDGLGNQTQVFNNLQGVVDGTGPNPAMAMLNNTTGANVANTAALMAGQRGASVNPGMIARQVATQGANLQQNAIGQGAALQANQSINALNTQGNIAGQQAGNAINMQNAVTNAQLNEQGNILNAINGLNNANVANTSQMNQVNNAQSLSRAAAQQQLMGNVMGAAGTAITGMPSGGGAKPGKTMAGDNFSGMDAAVMMAAEGGKVEAPKGPRSGFGRYLMAKGGQVPALVSPGEKYLDPKDVSKVANGANPMTVGKTIPGKPVVAGAKDSYANDTVPMKLEEGGIVLPRSVTQGKDPGKKAAAFVEAILNQSNSKKKSSSSKKDK